MKPTSTESWTVESKLGWEDSHSFNRTNMAVGGLCPMASLLGRPRNSLPVPVVSRNSITTECAELKSDFLCGCCYLIRDRSSLFTKAVLAILESGGVKSVRLPARSPNLNALAERSVRSIKSECLDRMILIGKPSLRRAVDQFCEHCHRERNHQGLENKTIEPELGFVADREVSCRERLGGLLRYYHRDEA